MAENEPVDGESTVMGISLLILVLASIPTLMSRAFAPATFGLFLTGVAAAVIFGVLNSQGYGWDDLGAVQIMTLLLFLAPVATAVNVIGGTANIVAVFTVLTFLFSVYAVWRLFASENRLPHLAFLFLAVLLGAGTGVPATAGSIIGGTGMALVIVAALLTIFAWPIVEERTETTA